MTGNGGQAASRSSLSHMASVHVMLEVLYYCRSLGGFKQMPLLEDVDLVCRLRKHGPPALVRKPIITSARRWQRLGFIHTTLLNQAKLFPHLCLG